VLAISSCRSSAPPGGQRGGQPGDVGGGRDLGGVDELGGFALQGDRRGGDGAAGGLPVHLGQPGVGEVAGGDPGGDHGGQGPAQPGALPAVGAAFTIFCMWGGLDVLAGDRGDDRGGEPLAQPSLGIGVLADQARPAGCRSGER